MTSFALPALLIYDDCFGVPYPVVPGRALTGNKYQKQRKGQEDSQLKLEQFELTAGAEFIALAHSCPHMSICPIAFWLQRRFAKIEVSLQGQDGEATRTHRHGVSPSVMKSDPEWLHLALEYATTTLQELSALHKSVFIGGFLHNRHSAPCLPLFLLILLPRGD